MSQAQRTHLFYFILLALTFAAFLIAERQAAEPWLMGLVLVTAWIKGQIVVDYFMRLRRVRRRLWRNVVSGWLFIILAVIAYTYWLSITPPLN